MNNSKKTIKTKKNNLTKSKISQIKIHYKNFEGIIKLFILFFFLFSTQGLTTDTPFIERTNGDIIFPFQETPYSLLELKEKLSPVLNEGTTEEFWPFLEAIFDPKFPRAIHDNATIVNGWRCLYNKLSDNQNDATAQMNALYQLLSLPGHLRLLNRIFPDLAQKIPTDIFACDECMKSTRNAYLKGK